MLEKQGIIKALRRSFKLVRGAWWRVFGIQLLAVVLVFIVGAIVEIPTSLIAMVIGGDNAMDWLSGESVSVGWTFLIVVGVGGVISSTITFPISAGVTALLYMDQRIRREALDLELARAARECRATPTEGHGRGPADRRLDVRELTAPQAGTTGRHPTPLHRTGRHSHRPSPPPSARSASRLGLLTGRQRTCWTPASLTTLVPATAPRQDPEGFSLDPVDIRSNGNAKKPRSRALNARDRG